MKKMTKFVAIVLAMMLVLSMGSVAAAEGALKIGFIGPLTGAAAVYGTSAMQGGQIAVDEINAAGGVNGAKIDYKFEDDVADGETAVNAYNKLMDDGMKVFVGSTTSGSCVAAGQKAFEDRVFTLTPSASLESSALYSFKSFTYIKLGTITAQIIIHTSINLIFT